MGFSLTALITFLFFTHPVVPMDPSDPSSVAAKVCLYELSLLLIGVHVLMHESVLSKVSIQYTFANFGFKITLSSFGLYLLFNIVFNWSMAAYTSPGNPSITSDTHLYAAPPGFKSKARKIAIAPASTFEEVDKMLDEIDDVERGSQMPR